MRVIDLFAGCGGLSLGFQKAGFEVVAAFDNWDKAIAVYEENFDHPIEKLDLSMVRDYSFLKKYEADLIIGGPPCQDFSSAGKRDENLGRADLTLTFANIIATIKPIFFIMENVERITKTETLQKALAIFKENGYGLTQRVLDASLCGVPQARKRFFLIGELGGKDDRLGYYFDKNLLKQPMTLADYFGDKLGVEFYYRHPRSYQRRGIFSIHEPSPTIRGVNRPIPKTYQKHPTDACEPNADLRSLTTYERSQIQTFPIDFQWFGTKSDLEQMIGNAVPVNLAQYVATCFQEYLETKNQDWIVESNRQLALSLD